ncbi:MAG: hypothetical protein APF81_18960 [Desulfosporosinus sp. BRH_c37]|nr:MAG: hypothetical protein APF81_18960 [Desulfosporosinus sp. BRH_c37]
MCKAVNDSTLTKLGDIYQYYIALKDCFEINDDEMLQIEINGDVSVISNSRGRFQKEVKHHLGTDFLSDRDIDFWKTLANWYSDYERIKQFSDLILFTTSQIKLDSAWNNWSNYDSTERLAVIKEIGVEVKSDEKGFRKQYNRIFGDDLNEKQLFEILQKITISHAQTDISGISNEFSKYVGHIPSDNRDNYIGALLGQILVGVKDPPHRWEVTKKEFELILQTTSPAFSMPSQRPLPIDYVNEIVPNEDAQKLNHKKFVYAIKAIEHDVMIPKAVSDYWKSDMTILRYFQNDPLYLEDLSRYRNTLGDRLFFEKDTAIRGANGKSKEKCVDLSKDFYNLAMRWDAKDFGSIIRNQDFFQRGIIHNIIDDGEIDWKVGDDTDGH